MVGWVTSVNQRAEASMQRINEFMDKKSEIINKNFDNYPIKGDIEFRNVSYVYPNTGIKALDNLSFTLKPENLWLSWEKPEVENLRLPCFYAV
jgi:ATP-binding cassette subfamily B protein